MSTYQYNGKRLTSVTLRGHGEQTLYPGKTYDLPEYNAYIQTLVAKKILVQVPVEATPEKGGAAAEAAAFAGGDEFNLKGP